MFSIKKFDSDVYHLLLQEIIIHVVHKYYNDRHVILIETHSTESDESQKQP